MTKRIQRISSTTKISLDLDNTREFISSIEKPAITQDNQSVTIKQPPWKINKDIENYICFQFFDGGRLKWLWNTTGNMLIEGEPHSTSYQILRDKAHNKPFTIARSEEQLQKGLQTLSESIDRWCPHIQVHVVKVFGVTWKQKHLIWGEQFEFSDGSILQMYTDDFQLVIHRSESTPTANTLGLLQKFSWSDINILLDMLCSIFPDNTMGKSRIEEKMMDSLQEEKWEPLENALDWQSFWPQDRQIRTAPNATSPCQRELLKDWSSILKHTQKKKHLLAHAPTGIGKTISSLVPTIAWIAQKPQQRRVYYLVNRVAQHENPIRELKDVLGAIFLQKTRMPLRVVDLVGREKLCDHPAATSLQKHCLRSREKASWNSFPPEILAWEDAAEFIRDQKAACPYHTLQALMPQAHVIICDYWWLFSQQAQSTNRLEQAGFSAEDSIVIIDEAHNLPTRVCDELSVEEPYEKIENEIATLSPEAHSCLQKIIETVLNSDPKEGISPSQLVNAVGGESVVKFILDILLIGETQAENSQDPLPIRILRAILQPDDRVVIFPYEKDDDKYWLAFRLIDATPTLNEGYRHVFASITMSGTLAAPADSDQELRYQLPIFGLSSEAIPRIYASPFSPLNQRWIYVPDTLGTYNERKKHINTYVKHIQAVGEVTPGATAVFFSSYSFLRDVWQSFSDQERELIIREEQGNIDASNPNDLKAYGDRVQTLVKEHGRAYLFAIYKGKIAEGADFRGNLIKTVVCVSLPQEFARLHHQKLEELYKYRLAPLATTLREDVTNKAREFARSRLSLSLILQACGRGIRSEADRCAFVLLDKRYDNAAWRSFLSPRPFNLPRPELAVSPFHYPIMNDTDAFQWDNALLKSYK